MNNLLSVNDFAVITSAKKMKGSGLNNGDVVMVSALKVAPVSAKDPYLQRVYVIALKFENMQLLIPNDTNEAKAYLIDPRNIERLPDEEQSVLVGHLRKQFGSSNEATGGR